MSKLMELYEKRNKAVSDARAFLDGKRGGDGKYVLDGSLTKPYIKLEKQGKPSKWVTFYALLAEKERTAVL